MNDTLHLTLPMFTFGAPIPYIQHSDTCHKPFAVNSSHSGTMQARLSFSVQQQTHFSGMKCQIVLAQGVNSSATAQPKDYLHRTVSVSGSETIPPLAIFDSTALPAALLTRRLLTRTAWYSRHLGGRG